MRASEDATDYYKLINVLRKENMSPQLEKKILNKLDKIEDLLIQIVPQRTELTEGDVLEIIAEGDREYKEGKTKILHSLKALR